MQAREVGAETLEIVRVEGGTLTVETAGAGRPLVLIHGWTLDHRTWRPQRDHFARTCHVVAYDRRGCGSSTAPPDLAREVDDVAAILDTVGLERAAIVGLSQGCRVALGFALRYPQRVAALALAGSPLPYREVSGGTEAFPIGELAALACAERYALLHDRLRAHPLMQLGGLPNAGLLDTIIRAYRGRDLIRHAGELPIDRDALAGLAVPALILVGERDSIFRRAAAEKLAKLLPQGRLDVIPDAYHLCNLSHAERFNASLGDFLDRHHRR